MVTWRISFIYLQSEDPVKALGCRPTKPDRVDNAREVSSENLACCSVHVETPPSLVLRCRYAHCMVPAQLMGSMVAMIDMGNMVGSMA